MTAELVTNQAKKWREVHPAVPDWSEALPGFVVPGYAQQLRTAFGAAIFLGSLACVMMRPRHLPEGVAALGGAALMVSGGYLAPNEAVSVLEGQWNVYGFFLGLLTISALADQAGIFERLAFLAAHFGHGNAWRLYVAVFVVGTVISAFLSNDATALILTPAIYALVRRLRLPVLPFMLACTFIADTASFIMPVSNPINILILDNFSGDLATFLRFLLLPSVFCVGFNILLFSLLFRRELRLRYDPSTAAAPGSGGPRYSRRSATALVLIAAGYVVAALQDVPVALIALPGALVLLVVAARDRSLDAKRLWKDISWSIFPFITGMFLLIRAVSDLGLGSLVGATLTAVGGADPFRMILATSFGSAIGANLLNNVPMAILMTEVIRTMPADTPGYGALPYATILGADLGPNLTVVGSLATMLWVLLLRKRGIEVSVIDYLKTGLLAVPVMLAVSSWLLLLRW